MNEYALNAAAEFQVRGDHAQAVQQSNQAAKYEALEYALTREGIQRENAERTIAGLRNVRSNISRKGVAELHGKAAALALFGSLYGEQQGRELLEEMSAGVSKSAPRQTRIRNFTVTVEHSAAHSFRYSLSSPRVHRDELKGILADAIKAVRNQVSPEAPLPSPEGITPNAPPNRVQESRTESRATSMATATVISPVEKKTSSAKQSKSVSTPKVARATKASAKNKAAVKEMEPVQQPQQAVEVTPKVTTPVVEAPGPATQDVAQETAANQHWTKWRGTPENLPAPMANQAKADYEKWVEKKQPLDAERYTLAQYIGFRIEKSLAAEQAAENVVEQAAVAAGAPSQKSWRLQKGGYEALSESHKEQAKADYEKYMAKAPRGAVVLEQYCAEVQEYSAKDIAMGKTMLIAKSNIQKGLAVDLTNSDAAHHLLKTAFDGRGGNDALGTLRTNVDKNEAKSITLKNAFTLTVERNDKDTVVRTYLKALPGKEDEVKHMFDKAATVSFNKAGTDQTKDRGHNRSSAELGR